jgi:biopolymer transport protein ExbB
MSQLSSLLQPYVAQVNTLATDGGWLMYPLTLLAFLIYFEAIRLWLKILAHPIYRSKKSPHSEKLVHWLAVHVKTKESNPLVELKSFEHLRSHIMQYFQRRSIMIGRFVKSGPLLGLLGTVMGMLDTFQGMTNHGLDRSENMAAGISQALITTQYGLLVAIPGMVLLSAIHHSLQRFNRNFKSLRIEALLEAKTIKSSSSTYNINHALSFDKHEAQREGSFVMTKTMTP